MTFGPKMTSKAAQRGANLREERVKPPVKPQTRVRATGIVGKGNNTGPEAEKLRATTESSRGFSQHGPPTYTTELFITLLQTAKSLPLPYQKVSFVDAASPHAGQRPLEKLRCPSGSWHWPPSRSDLARAPISEEGVGEGPVSSHTPWAALRMESAGFFNIYGEHQGEKSKRDRPPEARGMWEGLQEVLLSDVEPMDAPRVQSL